MAASHPLGSNTLATRLTLQLQCHVRLMAFSLPFIAVLRRLFCVVVQLAILRPEPKTCSSDRRGSLKASHRTLYTSAEFWSCTRPAVFGLADL